MILFSKGHHTKLGADRRAAYQNVLALRAKEARLTAAWKLTPHYKRELLIYRSNWTVEPASLPEPKVLHALNRASQKRYALERRWEFRR